jgi:hypothetical protein
MSKNRVTYNCQGIYIGPSPSSGDHFIDVNGNLNNTTDYSTGNFNLIKRISRVTNLSYQITLPREEIKQIGKSTIAAHPIINNPNIALDFEYYPNGIVNEARLGFNINTFDKNLNKNIYQNNFDAFIFSGLNVYQENILPTGRPFWPGNNRSCKNIFATITKQDNKDEIITHDTGKQINFVDNNVIAFGDAYITNYSTTCSVGNLPKVNTSFISDNVVFYTSSSGQSIPSINPKNGLNFSGKKFVIPNEADVQDLFVIAPGDITVDIQKTGNGTQTLMDNIADLGIKFSDIKLQNYSINIPFEREDLNSIGYKAPSIRRLNFPVKVDLKFSAVVGEESNANLRDILINDDKYNITIKMKKNLNPEIIRYDFKNAFLENFNYNSSVGQNRIIDFSLTTYCAPDDISQGFFISGTIPNENSTISY